MSRFDKRRWAAILTLAVLGSIAALSVRAWTFDQDQRLGRTDQRTFDDVIRRNSERIYVPFLQNPRHADARYVVRVIGEPGTMLPGLVREVGRVDPDVPVTETMTRETQAELGASNVRLTGAVVGYAALLTMVLTAIGLYGVLAFSVHRRTKELGIRMALGATARTVRGTVLRQGLFMTTVGTLVGLVLAAGSTRFMAHMLYGPPAMDMLVHLGSGIAIALVGLLVCWLPARRASRVEPMAALRIE